MRSGNTCESHSRVCRANGIIERSYLEYSMIQPKCSKLCYSAYAITHIVLLEVNSGHTISVVRFGLVGGCIESGKHLVSIAAAQYCFHPRSWKLSSCVTHVRFSATVGGSSCVIAHSSNAQYSHKRICTIHHTSLPFVIAHFNPKNSPKWTR
jgi:hypothetical protein